MKTQTCDNCKSAYVGKYYGSEKESNRRCLSHLPNGVEEVEFDRFEHLILKEIKETLPGSEYYGKNGIIEPRYDRILMKGVRERPDLIIRSPLEGSSIVIVEVDEGYHDNAAKKLSDAEREEFFRNKLTQEYSRLKRKVPKISFVRIEPFDGKLDSIVEKMCKLTLSPGRKSEKVVKSGKFDEVIKASISVIRKKLTRRAPGTETLRITPMNYSSYSTPRSPLNAAYSKIFPRRRSTLYRETEKVSRGVSSKNVREKTNKTKKYSSDPYEFYEDEYDSRQSSSSDSLEDKDNEEYDSYPETDIYEDENPSYRSRSNQETEEYLYKNRYQSQLPPYPRSSATISPVYSKPKSEKIPLFTKEQKSKISNLLKNDRDYTSYVSSIYGKNFKKSKIKLRKTDPIQSYIHIIQGAALGYSDNELIKGVEKIRKMSYGLKPSLKRDLLKENSGKTSSKNFKEIYSSRLITNRKPEYKSKLKQEIS